MAVASLSLLSGLTEPGLQAGWHFFPPPPSACGVGLRTLGSSFSGDRRRTRRILGGVRVHLGGMDMQKSLLSAISIATVLSCSAPAYADVLTFEMQTQSPRKVLIVFYSESRNRAWPGGNNAYVMSRHRPPLVYSYPLQCRRGEKICFGAWEPKNSELILGRRQGRSQQLLRLLLHLPERFHGFADPGRLSRAPVTAAHANEGASLRLDLARCRRCAFSRHHEIGAPDEFDPAGNSCAVA